MGGSRMAHKPCDLGRHRVHAGGHENDRRQIVQPVAEIEKKVQGCVVDDLGVVDTEQQRTASSQVPTEPVQAVHDRRSGLIGKRFIGALRQERRCKRGGRRSLSLMARDPGCAEYRDPGLCY